MSDERLSVNEARCDRLVNLRDFCCVQKNNRVTCYRFRV